MITGIVTRTGDPVVMLLVAGRFWRAVIDTGFNGDLELPEPLRVHVQPQSLGFTTFILAGGQSISEECFSFLFPFDGQLLTAEATFVPGNTILIGTHLMRDHRLEIDFPARVVKLERMP